MKQTIYQVDAFTAKPFAGNPAAVCLLPEERAEAWMQNVAMEMNLSETAFLIKQADGYGLRWFTPACEVELCGHATLASAHILWETGQLAGNQDACFHTKSGLLTASKLGDWIAMNFPAVPAVETECPMELLDALGISPLKAKKQKNRMDYMIEVDSEETVRNLKPNFSMLSMLNIRGVIVTSASQSGEYDFVSRFFAPGVGVDEDPVTGSAHCCLAPYWCNQLGRDQLTGFQASKRGGIVKVQIQGERVILQGQAVTVMQGILSD